MNTIKLLDDKTINKIAAGEVVERPSSVVKELIENSIDAKASSISIEIKDAGKKYIRITDNGCGISYDDLDIAFMRHSTSKIERVEDLDKIISLGFRGEALASISAVSEMEVLTRTVDKTLGCKVVVENGQVNTKEEVGCPIGTTIIVKNLFTSIPVRLKFLKNNSTESSYITDIVNKMAIGNPNISFKLIKDDKLIMKTPGKGDILTTIYSIFGKEFIDSLFKTSYNGEDIRIHGFVSNPSFTRGNRNHQYVFVNGRYIKSDEISKIIESQYTSLVPINRFPVFAIFLEIEPNKIDVNVHPTKTEIRFNNLELFSQVLKDAISKTLKEHNLIPEVKISKASKDAIIQEQFIDDVNEDRQEYILDDKKQNLQEETNHNVDKYEDINHLEISTNVDFLIPKEISKQYAPKKTHQGNEQVSENTSYNYENNLKKNELIRKEDILPKLKIIGTLFDTYILGEDRVNNAFYLIDQHAAHERVMYEKYKYEFENEEVVVQNLIAPEVINLSYNEFELALQSNRILRKLGFEIEEFGINSIALRSVPLLFGEPNNKNLFLEVLDNLDSQMKTNYELKMDKIIKLACTNSIKAGHNIRNIEIDRLLQDLSKAENPYTCPHGRPITVKITRYEIEKRFKRVQ